MQEHNTQADGSPIMVSDTSTDAGTTLAVINNGKHLVQYLNYTDPSDTRIQQIQVLGSHGQPVFETDIGPGKYLSALWVELQYHLDHFQADGKTLLLTHERIVSLQQYMGATVVADAQNPSLDNHGFLRSILGLVEGGSIVVVWDEGK